MREIRRKQITKEYGRIDFDEHQGSLADFAKYVNKLAEKYPTAKMECDTDYNSNGDGYYSYHLYENRFETDEELEKRKADYLESLLQREIKDADKIVQAKLKKEAKAQRKEQEERKMFEKLQKKYGVK